MPRRSRAMHAPLDGRPTGVRAVDAVDDARAHGDPFVPRSMRGAPRSPRGAGNHRAPPRRPPPALVDKDRAEQRGCCTRRTDASSSRRPCGPNLRRRSTNSSSAPSVLHTQGTVCAASLQANRPSLVEELELQQVLRRIAEAAVELVGARYGALGVISPDGGLEQFIHVGTPPAEAAADRPPRRGTDSSAP